jgi:uncharacterized protein
MKKFLSIALLLLSFTAIAQSGKDIPARPQPPKLVNVLVDQFMTEEQIDALERKLVAYDDSTSNQIAVVVVDDLKGFSAADYAMAIGREWGVGNKDFNNGVVVLISTGGGAGNRDAFIATGYGLEGAIPDLTAKVIVDNDIIPNFRAENYYRGLDEATDALIEAAEGRYTAPEGYGSRGKKRGIPGFVIVIGVIVLLTLIGAGSGNSGGGYVSRRGYRGWGGPWVGGGGWSGGGGGWSGGGGGGGFGGFGGGGFGGGGAGGKW